MNTILQKKNIILNCRLSPKKISSKKIGKIFSEDGYTSEKYTQAMLDKEEVFNTAIGNASPFPTALKPAKGKSKNRVWSS